METKRNKNLEINELELHDAEIKPIIFNYASKTAELKLILNLHGGEVLGATLYFYDVDVFTITLTEPWGSGKYISKATIKEVSKQYSFRTVLNSGDEIYIKSNNLEYIPD
ncbi:hypothetical protein RJI07_01685 [Mycoplasmatota bacterium WC30]